MAYLLDTNIVSEFVKKAPNLGLLTWVAQVQDDLYLSAVTCGEIQAGIENIREAKPQKAADLEDFLERLIATYQVLPLDSGIMRQWGRLKQAHPNAPLEDALIAATAQVHDLTLVTRNEKDFRPLQIPLLNPFK